MVNKDLKLPIFYLFDNILKQNITVENASNILQILFNNGLNLETTQSTIFLFTQHTSMYNRLFGLYLQTEEGNLFNLS